MGVGADELHTPASIRNRSNALKPAATLLQAIGRGGGDAAQGIVGMTTQVPLVVNKVDMPVGSREANPYVITESASNIEERREHR